MKKSVKKFEGRPAAVPPHSGTAPNGTENEQMLQMFQSMMKGLEDYAEQD